MALDPLRR